MIEVASLSKAFGETEALADVSFEVPRGVVAGFLGVNGAGKTTTLRILVTALVPDAGGARVCGHDVLTRPGAVRRSIGYLPEQPPLDLEHTVVEYLAFCAALRDVPRRRRRARIDAVVDQCRLESVFRRRIGNLSKGFRQRVGLAQALVHDPEVLLLDEPTVGLDPRQIREMQNQIAALAGERTVLLSSHRLAEVQRICSRVVIIHEGRIVAEDALDALTADEGLEEVFLRLTSGRREAS